MFEKIYGRYFFITVLTLWVVMFLLLPVHAANPVIIRHDAHLMEKEVRINLAWQSDEPIVKIIASAGKEQVVIVDNIENERNERGYSGEIDIIVPAYIYNAANERTLYMSSQSSSAVQQRSSEVYTHSASAQNDAIQYSVQIIDEVNQRSILLKDKVRRIEASQSQSVRKPIQKSIINNEPVKTKSPLKTTEEETQKTETVPSTTSDSSGVTYEKE